MCAVWADLLSAPPICAVKALDTGSVATYLVLEGLLTLQVWLALVGMVLAFPGYDRFECEH